MSDDNWDDIYNQIASQILNDEGVLINADLHLKTIEKLSDAIHQGVGGLEISEEDQKKLAQRLKQNIYPFSAAKSFTQMQYYRDMMIGDNGKILSYSAFIKKIADTGEIFNKKYLSAEYENAYYSTIMAEQWDRFAEDSWLQYSTVGDNNVRPSHAMLDKYTAPKSDSFWKNNYPPNGWKCRCFVIPGKPNYKNKLTAQEAGSALKEENRHTPFYNNVGLSKVIFKENHPYFINAKGKAKELSWEQYGLPSLQKIRVNRLPEYQPTTKEEYFEWWNRQAKIKGTDDILVKDKLGNDILLDSGIGKKKKIHEFYKDHIIKKDNENRFHYGTESINVLKNPDEIWLNKTGEKFYLKYYENGVIELVVDQENTAVTLYKIEKKHNGRLEGTRRGILLSLK